MQMHINKLIMIDLNVNVRQDIVEINRLENVNKMHHNVNNIKYWIN